MYAAVLLHPLLQQLGVSICPEGVKGSHILATLVWHMHMSCLAFAFGVYSEVVEETVNAVFPQPVAESSKLRQSFSDSCG